MFMSDLSEIKGRQREMWAAGDYAAVATPLLIVSELLCEAADLRGGSKVLDVATGSGNTALGAARRRCEVTGIDYVASLLERARERAAVERLDIRFEEGDVEALPYPDGSFDVVLSTFGVMFAPDQERAARELLRVCRAGGRIALTNWTPEGFVGQWFQVTARYAPPPPGLKPPLRWGTEAGLRALFERDMRIERRHYVMRYRSPQHWLEYFRSNFGPTRQTFERLDAEGQESFAADLIALAQRFNRSGDDTFVGPGEYLEVVLTV
ncbi:MAG: SAM-dependent methyltransferase [Burkholderiales bacterium]|jgi:ubiquinone/menaquinone biosynthesis C-methylase UbiE|nr:SAM-dependent methyltransferase [Burkholderiales bacterium]